MSPDDVVALFNTMVDDAPDVDEAFALMDAAYTMRNESRIWTFLLKLDSSITHSSSDTWQTQKTLPTDFEEPYRLNLGAGDNEYDGVPYEQILRWIGSANKYSIDYQGNTLRFTGPGSGQTAYLWYKYGPTSLIGLTDVQKAATGTIVWPKRFCSLLAFDMAAMHQGGIEADEITRQQVPYLNDAHKRLFNAMVNWDNRRRMKMFDNSASPRRNERNTPADVVDW